MADIQRSRKLVLIQTGSTRLSNTCIQVERPRYEREGVQERELVWRSRAKNYNNRTSLLNAHHVGVTMLMYSFPVM